MNKNNIINLNEDNRNFDKMQIALAIRNSTYDGGTAMYAYRRKGA